MRGVSYALALIVLIIGSSWCQWWKGDTVPDAGWKPECEGGEGHSCVQEEGEKSSCGGTHEGEAAKAKKGSYGSEYAIKNEA